MTGAPFLPPLFARMLIQFNSRAREIRIWTLEGDTLFTLSGHTSFVYSLTVLPDGKIASGGEDRTLRIWRGRSPFSIFLWYSARVAEFND